MRHFGQIVTYSRFSPRPDAKDSKSIEQQQAFHEEWAAKNGRKIRARFEDRDASGADRDREGLAEAIKACKRGGILLVYEWDRLGRDPLKMMTIAETLAAKRCRLVSCIEGDWDDDNDPTKELLSTILAALAKYRRITSNKRTSTVMKRRQREGERMSKIAPYGWTPLRRRIVIEPGEQAVIERIKRLKADGYGIREIARRLNALGIDNRGHQWNHMLVKSILRRAEESATRSGAVAEHPPE